MGGWMDGWMDGWKLKEGQRFILILIRLDASGSEGVLFLLCMHMTWITYHHDDDEDDDE